VSELQLTPLSEDPRFREIIQSLLWLDSSPQQRKEFAMLFMVVEQFRNQDAKAIYRRLSEKGRMMPEGLTFVSSWVAADLSRCFQLMECGDVNLFQRWIAEWSDLMQFEIVPVISGKETAVALAGQL
jgi:Protein of unknown function (DUF3303)